MFNRFKISLDFFFHLTYREKEGLELIDWLIQTYTLLSAVYLQVQEK